MGLELSWIVVDFERGELDQKALLMIDIWLGLDLGTFGNDSTRSSTSDVKKPAQTPADALRNRSGRPTE